MIKKNPENFSAEERFLKADEIFREKMQEIANVLDVTLDYLKGNIDYVICPVCGFLDNPLSELSRKEHEVFHAKFLSVKEKYPLLYLA